MPSLLLVLISLICALLAYISWKQRKRLHEPPLYPGAWPVVGHVISAMGRKKLWKFVRKLELDVSRGEGLCTLVGGPVKMYAICNPDYSLAISNQCLEKSIHYKYAKTWLGDSLLTAQPSIWKKDRKMLMPAFNQHVLVGFMESLNESAIQVVEKMKTNLGKDRFDHSPYIHEYAIDALCKTVLGIDIPNKKKYIHVTETLADIIVKRFINIIIHVDTIYNWTNLKKIENECCKYVNDIADAEIQKKRSERERKSQNYDGVKKNFLELLLDISRVESMTDVKIRDQLNMMIAAGFDTVSIALVITLVMIGSNENIQEKVYEEIVEVLGDTSGELKPSHLDRLVYMEAVIKETIRLYPPAPVVLREINENIRLENYTLYAGHSCLLFLGAVNLHPIWGEDAQLFKPERWLDPTTIPDHPAAFATFSMGRRNCIGKYFAMMSMKTFVVHLMRNFYITADCTKLELAEDFILRVVSGHHINLQQRS